MYNVLSFAIALLGTCGLTVEQDSKVLLIYDMEGLTDVTSPGTTVESESYPAARRSLVEDVNAAIAGLKRAGAGEIVLVDGHGSGNPEPDYPLAELPRGARHEIRDAPFDPYLAVADADGDYDAVVAVGMHAGSGSAGFLAHTMLAHARWTANEHSMNETAIVAAFAGRAGVPLVLVTGDDVLKTEIEAFSPETRYVTVKETSSYGSATAMPRERSSQAIEAAAFEAFRQRSTIPPWRALLEGPIENEFGYRTVEQTELASLYPGAVVLNDKAVRLHTEDLSAGYLAYRALAHYTFLAHMRAVVETIYELEDGDAILRRIGERFPPPSERTFTPSARARVLSIFGTHGSR